MIRSGDPPLNSLMNNAALEDEADDVDLEGNDDEPNPFNDGLNGGC
jgi:hypothetical protein